MKDEVRAVTPSFHPSYFILVLEPVAQMDESAGLRSLRAHVRVVPGSLISVRGRPEGGRLSLEQETRVRVLPPEYPSRRGGVKGRRAAPRSPWASPVEGSIPSPGIPSRGSGANGRHTALRRRPM
jgi:hypothetical protein